MSSCFGEHFKISVFGESHGAGIGVTLDGLPAGIPLDLKAISMFMARRAPGGVRGSTTRRETDVPEILSGVFDGKTTGAPLAALIRNRDTHSDDYDAFSHIARPGHADYTGFVRYGGHNDVRGGGHFSGRLTAPLCFAGAVAIQILQTREITVGAHLASVADVSDTLFDAVALDCDTLLRAGKNAFPVLDKEVGDQMLQAIEAARAAMDSVGGVVECAALGLPAGVGTPMFAGLESRISAIIFGIPAVKGVEFGAGFAAASLYGSENNDSFIIRENGTVATATNNAGGILGGISTGMPLVVRAAFKPTPSIARGQSTVDFIACTSAATAICGRHDPCVATRAVPAVEAAVAVALLDSMLEAYGYRTFFDM